MDEAATPASAPRALVGLTNAGAQRRLTQYGPNEIPERRPHPALALLKKCWGPIPSKAPRFSTRLSGLIGRFNTGLSGVRGLVTLRLMVDSAGFMHRWSRENHSIASPMLGVACVML